LKLFKPDNNKLVVEPNKGPGAIEKQTTATNEDYRNERAKEGIEETDAKIEARFAKLRLARAKKTDGHGNKTYEDVWDNINHNESAQSLEHFRFPKLFI
jgi:hypothetical protein